MMELKEWWERQYSITAGKHMQQNMTMVLRCGEHSNGYMYVEHGALLVLEKTGCGRGLGNGSALVSEFWRELLDFIEVYDQNTHETRGSDKGQNSVFMQKLVCSHVTIAASVWCFSFSLHTCF